MGEKVGKNQEEQGQRKTVILVQYVRAKTIFSKTISIKEMCYYLDTFELTGKQLSKMYRDFLYISSVNQNVLNT